MEDNRFFPMEDSNQLPESRQVFVPGDPAGHRSNLHWHNILLQGEVFHTALSGRYLTRQQERPVPFLAESIGHQDRLNRRPTNVQTGNDSRNREVVSGIHCALRLALQSSTMLVWRA